MREKYSVIRKWYHRLGFLKNFDGMFEELLYHQFIVRDEFRDNPQENFLTALYMCEGLEQAYVKHGIAKQVLEDTLSDLIIWTNVWYELTGELGLMETEWLERHFSFKLFRLGRLQFCIGEAEREIEYLQIPKGAPIIEIHIPSGAGLSSEECKASIEMAQKFFARYFPEHEYKCFTCHSWLLDKTLHSFLHENSNILKFQALFHVVEADPSDAILKYVFRWDTTRETLEKYEAQTALARRVKEYARKGGEFYEAYGVIKGDLCGGDVSNDNK